MGRTTKKKSCAPEPTTWNCRRKHDQSYKRLCAEPLAGLALVSDFAAKGWAHELAPATLRLFPTETIGDDLKRQLGDCAW